MMRKLKSLLERKIATEPPIPTEVTAAGQSQERIESVSLVEVDNSASAVLAERKRISVISAVASPSQAEMRDKLIAEGTPADDAVLALCADAKTRPAPAAAPAVTEAGVAKEMLALINSVALPAASTLAQDDVNVKTKMAEIENPSEAATYYAQNREELANTKINFNFKKEG